MESDFAKYSRVDRVVGAEFASRILLDTKKFFGMLCLKESHFGWVTQGPPQLTSHNHKTCFQFVGRLRDVLSQF